MRIGINCRTILNPGFGEGAGVGHYTYYLVKNLLRLDQKNEYYLYFDELITDDAINDVIKGAPNVTIKRFPFHQYKKFLPFAYSHFLVTSFLGKDRLNVFHAPSGILPYTFRNGSVITIHDLAIYKHPEWFPEGRISKSISTKMLVPKSVVAASRIIAVSQSTKKDLIDIFNVKEEKISVIYEGVELPSGPDSEGYCKLSQPVKKKHDINKDYFLTLGTLEPRKNINLVLNALIEILKEKPSVLKDKEYLIAGLKGWKYEQVFEKIEEVNNVAQEKIGEGLVRYLGYIQHGNKFPLIACSSFFIFPSLYEGFGLPVLEAMKMGIPVITSNISSIPEVCGNAALLIDPSKPDEMKRALYKFLEDDNAKKDFSARGQKRAQDFSWELTAQKTIDLYKKLK